MNGSHQSLLPVIDIHHESDSDSEEEEELVDAGIETSDYESERESFHECYVCFSTTEQGCDCCLGDSSYESSTDGENEYVTSSEDEELYKTDTPDIYVKRFQYPTQ
jgi:hypothetical protein